VLRPGAPLSGVPEPGCRIIGVSLDTLFTSAEGIERLWEVSTALLEPPPPVRLYAPPSIS